MRVPGWLSGVRPTRLFRPSRSRPPVARVVLGFTIFGLVVAVAGLVLAAVLSDRFLGLALLIVGAFLMILPYTRPHVDE